MKLYEIPRDSKIKCECSDGSKYITFHRIDGMYSFCSTEKGGICHLFAGTELEKENDYYVLVIPEKES